MNFAELSPTAQVRRMRAVAVDALERRGLAVERLRLLEHGFNTTFRVDTVGGERFALRVSVGSAHGADHVRPEVEWLAALAADTDIVAPTPAPTDGRLVVDVPCAELGRDLPTVLFSWLPGADLGAAPTAAKWRAAGALMARLHLHAERWRPTADSVLPDIADPMHGLPSRLDDRRIDAAARRVMGRALDHAVRAFAELRASVALRPVHADLHGWNLKWYRGRVSVLDFDDCGMGLPVQDLAISTYYLRDDDEVTTALIDGYRTVAEPPTATTEQFEAIVASRNLLLLNDLLVTDNAEHAALLPRYIANTTSKLRHYLDTGTYRHDVPGVQPLG